MLHEGDQEGKGGMSGVCETGNAKHVLNLRRRNFGDQNQAKNYKEETGSRTETGNC